MSVNIRISEQPQEKIIPENYHTYHLSMKEKVKFFLLSGAGFAVLTFLFYQNLFLFFLSLPAQWFLLPVYRKHLSEKRRKEIKEQFRDVLYSISASVAAGRQMSGALQETAGNMRMIYGGQALIVQEIERMSKKINEYRESEEEVLRDFADRTDIEDISDFVDIYLTCRKTGGDLIRVLGKACEIITDKITIEKEIHTITAQKRFETKILTAIPILIILFLQFISPEYISVLYDGITGRLLMTAALAGIGASYYISTELTKIEV
jgi:tight adherence protein B